MTRPTLRPLPSLCLAVVALLGLGACGGRDPAVVPAAPTFNEPRLGAAPPAASAAPTRSFNASSIPPQAMRDQAALAAACRQDADRIITTRDRGQLMREDERDSRIGSQASIFAQRTETDRLGRIFERDRIAADCVQENTRTTPQR
jgi:hypothetical protein